MNNEVLPETFFTLNGLRSLFESDTFKSEVNDGYITITAGFDSKIMLYLNENTGQIFLKATYPFLKHSNISEIMDFIHFLNTQPGFCFYSHETDIIGNHNFIARTYFVCIGGAIIQNIYAQLYGFDYSFSEAISIGRDSKLFTPKSNIVLLK
jgi:hypothetical protein